jgi:hypothetical protein
MGSLTQSEYEKGVAQGGADTLTRFLEKRFGVLPRTLRERIFTANLEQIEAWVDLAVDAPDLPTLSSTLLGEDERIAPLDYKLFHEILLRIEPDGAHRIMLRLILTTLLEKRFGEVPTQHDDRIWASDLEQLKTLLGRACEVSNLEAVLGSD